MKGSTSPAVINGLRRISPITVETIKEFSQVMKSQTFKECSQRSAFNMSSRLCIAGFIFETGSRPENFIFHHSFPQRSQHLDWAFTGQPNGCIANEKLPLRALNSPTGSSDWPSRKRDNYLPEQ
jgi:hypothetical protein